ncbi:hypothetical protein QLL95_gp0899 [Cotonvirus japonicus]|uniref:Ankyrin repeat protein n=1 Tax=Cotonvirus japonicus TaxID=2811091 RepID=A0ABM7NST1_9VIRU|nr:hypothetical protein QLL95_gp0899 [Cotonvirus japonicus]BCS83224.1 hypothetical protein [Cotonvirus japonicus]
MDHLIFNMNEKITSNKYEKILQEILTIVENLENTRQQLNDNLYFYNCLFPQTTFEIKSKNMEIAVKAKSKIAGKILLVFMQMFIDDNLNLIIELLKDTEHCNIDVYKIIDHLCEYNNNNITVKPITNNFGNNIFSLNVSSIKIHLQRAFQVESMMERMKI